MPRGANEDLADKSTGSRSGANFWFVPTVMVAGAVILSLVTIDLDKARPTRIGSPRSAGPLPRGPQGSRAVLSTVAGSMMTITSVTFSITIVALQLASSQFGPRLLRNFMRDRGNQISLGTFIATFAYCLLILRTVNGTEEQRFVPHISVTIGLLMALTSLGVLIYFIHHAAASIQAENVIADVGRDLDQALARIYPECVGVGPQEKAEEQTPPPGFDHESRPSRQIRSDYLQTIDVNGLMDLAREHDLIIGVPHRPGKFLVAAGDLARVWPGDRLDDEVAGAIRRAFYLGPQRTLTQDVEFAIDQLVEIAVRALSPESTTRSRRSTASTGSGPPLSPWPGGRSLRPAATTTTAGSASLPTRRRSGEWSTPPSTRSARPRGMTLR